MLYSREIAYVVAAVTVSVSGSAEACHVQIHYTKAQVNAAHIALYEHEEGLRDKNPARFDQKNPVLGQLLSDQSAYDNLLHQSELHPKRFERQNPLLWKVLDGDRLYHEKHPFAAIPLALVSTIEAGGENLGNPGSGGVPPRDDRPSITSVPEPSTFALALSASIAGLLGVVLRRPWAILGHTD